MYRSGLRSSLILVLVWMLQASPALGQSEPLGLQLTWQQDPTTTMTIDWHLRADDPPRQLQYRQVGRDAWTSAEHSIHTFPYSDRSIYRAELTGLVPDESYQFRIGEPGRVFRFRTMPAEASRPIRFAAGGDVRGRQGWMDQMNRVAAGHDPDFVVFGGDLAYADGNPLRVRQWYEWFQSTMNTLVTRDGRQIPVVAGLGNHEIWYDGLAQHEADSATFVSRYGLEDQTATFFFDLFPFPGRPGYAALDFGDYLSLIILDTDHANPIVGEQTSWLEEALRQRTHVPHVFPVYHVPAYPSVREFDGPSSVRVRRHWVPLFERYGVRVAFENHDHAYKRTHPLTRGRVDPRGIVYLGDGAWGVGTREIGSRQDVEGPAWYLARAEARRHFILGTIDGSDRRFLVIDENGDEFDRYPVEQVQSRQDAVASDIRVYPNPASSILYVEFVVEEPAPTSVHIYDMLGRLVATLMPEQHDAQGLHIIPFDVGGLVAGPYVVDVRRDGTRRTRSIVVRAQ